MSPTQRAIRTLLQAMLALLPAVPVAVAGFGVDAAVAAKVGGAVALAVQLVTFCWNWLEERTGHGVLKQFP